MTLQERIEQINKQLHALQSPALIDLLKDRIEELTEKLIGEENEQTRGRIKALRDLLNLPKALQHEHEGITAELSEESDSAT